MKMREKIIIMVLFLAVAFGVIVYFFSKEMLDSEMLYNGMFFILGSLATLLFKRNILPFKGNGNVEVDKK